MTGEMKSRRRNKVYRQEGERKRQPSESGGTREELSASNSFVVKCFSSYASELDLKHDKYERIVKLSRDVTIESKRIIFLLHTVDKEDRKHAVLNEAETRLNNVESTLFKAIGKELQGEDPYQFLRAYTSGLQEYAEAFTFYHYLKYKKLQSWTSAQKKIEYCVENEDESQRESELTSCLQSVSTKVLMPPSEYILGVADLTGELMRNCINCLGSGQLESCMQTCAFVKEIYNGFLGVGNSGPKEFSRKLYTLKQSLNKMENACYAICVRGSEIPKNMLADVLQDPGICDVYEDEGFY